MKEPSIEYALSKHTENPAKHNRLSGPPNQNTLKFLGDSLTPAAVRENQMLEGKFKTLGKPGISPKANFRSDLGTENDSRGLLEANFNKKWLELMSMIEYAKSLNENDSSKDAITEIRDYGKKTKPKVIARIKSATVEKQIVQTNTQSEVGQLLRKPMRTIHADLQKKLQDIRNSSSEWEALQQSVDRYEGINVLHSKNNFWKRNIKEVGTLDPTRLLEIHRDRVRRQKEKQIHVLETKKRMDDNELQLKLSQIDAKEKRLLQKLANEKDFLGNLIATQTKWYTIIFIAVRIKKIQEYLAQKQIERAIFLKKRLSAIHIQRWYRSFLNSKKEVTRNEAILVIGSRIGVYLKRWKVERLRRASFTIQLFFKEIYDLSKLLKVVKKYRNTVINGQRIIRAFLKIRKARVLAISKHWDTMEPEWWALKSKGASYILEPDNFDKSKDKKKKKGVAVKILPEIKHRLILENLIHRRKQFYKKIGDTTKKANSANETLYFKLLPSQTHLFDMMDRANEEVRGK